MTNPAASESTGFVDITVNTPVGTSPGTTADQIVYGPTIASISPTSGGAPGGTVVTVTGTGFNADGRVGEVFTAAGSVAVPYVLDSDTMMTLTMPASYLGRVQGTALMFGTNGVTGQANFTLLVGPTFTYQ